MIAFLALLLLFAAEFALRAYHQRTRNSALPMQLRPRTRDITWRDIRHKYRIVCFGDSVTYGESLPSGQDYPSVLADLLAQSHPGLDAVVINAGMGGNTSVQALARVERDVLWFRPHVVIVSFGLNDGHLGYWPLDPLRERRMRGDLLLWERMDVLLQHSHIYLTARGRTRRLLRRMGLLNGPLAVSTVGPPNPRVSHEGFALTQQRLAQRIQASGCRTVLLATMTPVSGAFHAELGPDWQQLQLEIYKAYNGLIRNAADGNGAQVVDLEQAFADPVRLGPLLMSDGVHLTADGERLVAQTVVQTLEDTGLPRSGPYQWR